MHYMVASNNEGEGSAIINSHISGCRGYNGGHWSYVDVELELQASAMTHHLKLSI